MPSTNIEGVAYNSKDLPLQYTRPPTTVNVTDTNITTQNRQEGEDGGRVQASYSDSKLDLCLTSNEGRRFDVHAYYLEAASGVIRGILVQRLYTTSMLEDPIGINASSSDLELYLDFVTKKPGYGLQKQWRQLRRVIILAEDLASKGVAEDIVAHAYHSLNPDAWEVFIAAAKYDNLLIARWAIEQLENHHPCGLTHTRLCLDDARLVPLPYLLGFIKAGVEKGRLCEGGIDYENWAEIARVFHPTV